MMLIYRANDSEQNDREEHSANKYWTDVTEYGSHKGIEQTRQQFTKEFAAKEKNQKCAYDYDHKIYSLATMLKPLLENCKFGVT